jgi:hypothetical protein
MSEPNADSALPQPTPDTILQHLRKDHFRPENYAIPHLRGVMMDTHAAMHAAQGRDGYSGGHAHIDSSGEES